MAEEEKHDQEQQQEPEAEAPDAEEPAAEEPAAEEPAPEEPAPEESAEESAAEEPADEPAAEEPAAGPPAPEEEAETPTPKQRRKLERARASGPPRPPRSPEERAAERAERRRQRAAARSRYRAGRRQRRGEPGTGTPPAERAPGTRKVRQGTVVSDKPDKTITVRIEVVRRHPTYEKVVRRSSTVRAHDERNEAQEGDIVRVVESRPLSRAKRWRLLEVLERAR